MDNVCYFGTWDNGRFGVSQVLIDGGTPEQMSIPVANADLCDLNGNRLLVRSLPPGGFPDALAPLAVVPLLGGSARPVPGVQAYDATWSASGDSITFSEGPRIYTIRQDGTERRTLATVPSSVGIPSAFIWWLRWSPDGNRLTFTVTYPGIKGSKIWELQKTGGTARELSQLRDLQMARCGTWTRDGRSLVFEGVRDSTPQMWILPDAQSNGRTPEPIPNSESFRGPLFDRDGKRLFVRKAQDNWEIARYNPATSDFSPLLRPVSANVLTFSRDGKSIAYTSAPEGALWMASAASPTKSKQLTEGPLEVAMPRWAPDATQIAFMARKYGQGWRIYLINVMTNEIRPLLPMDNSQQADPDWSKDGKSIVFGQNPAPATESGRIRHLSIYNLTNGKVEEIANSSNLHSPRWSPDGRYILAISARTQELVLYDSKKRSWRTITGPNPTGTGYPCWTKDSQRVYVLSSLRETEGTAENVILEVRVSTGEVKKFASLSTIRQSPQTFGTWIGVDQHDMPLAVRDLTRPTIDVFDWVQN